MFESDINSVLQGHNIMLSYAIRYSVQACSKDQDDKFTLFRFLRSVLVSLSTMSDFFSVSTTTVANGRLAISSISTIILYKQRKVCWTLSLVLNPFPNKPWFLRVCNTSLLKTLREKEKLLEISNFSFSHSVFYLSGELFYHFHQI